MYRLSRSLFLVTCLLLTPASALSQAGTLDPTFNGVGYVQTGFFGGGSDATGGTVVQPDGKIVVAGKSSISGGPEFLVMRYNADGQLDQSFNGTGSAVTALGNTESRAYAVALQADGKIVAGGYAFRRVLGQPSLTYASEFALVRYLPNGTLDASFDGDGKVTTSFGSTYRIDRILAVAVQPDGRIVVAGEAHTPGQSIAVARYNPDGSLDTTFSSDGKFTATIGSSSTAYALALQVDGKIVVTGTSNVGNANAFTTLRLDSNGELDQSFGAAGIARLAYPGSSDYATGLAVQSDGKILVSGGWGLGRFFIVRYTETGQLDPSFDWDGIWVPSSRFAIASATLLLQPDGKIVVAGTDSEPGTSRGSFAAVRINPNGSRDLFFGIRGKAFTHVGKMSVSAASAALGPDGRLIVAGHSVAGVPESSFDIAVARFSSSGTLDPSFGDDGTVITDVGTKGVNTAATALQPDGKIVAAGAVRQGSLSYNAIGLVRYDENGKIDRDFGNAGKASASFQDLSVGAYVVKVQPDGRILVGGSILRTGTVANDFMILRFLSDGSLDPKFGVGGIVITTAPGNGRSSITSLELQADGKIVALGTAYADLYYSPSITLFRYHSNGDLDTSFAGGAVAMPEIGDAAAGELAMQPDGRIVVVGTIQPDRKPVVLRFRPDGWIDRTFNRRGYTIVQLGLYWHVTGEDVAIQPDGRIVISTDIVRPGANSKFGAVRLNQSGQLDTTFGDGGIVEVPITERLDLVTSIAIQYDGKLILGGSAGYWGEYDSGLGTDFAAVRLNSDGSRDTSWGIDGIARIDLVGQDVAGSLAIDQSGRIVLGGRSRGGFGIARLLGDGNQVSESDKH